MKSFLVALATAGVLSAAESALVQPLVPGITVRELPVRLTSLNNIEYAPDGRLFGGGYDGRYHLLRDTDGDGLEDKVDTFHDKPSPNYPLGIVVRDGEPYFVLADEVIRFRDTDRDDVPDTREVFASGFDLPGLAIADPNPAINPDGVGYIVTLKDGSSVTGTRLRETAIELQIAQPGGAVARLQKTNIAKTEPLSVSLMPAGLDKNLSPSELRDLMTYLLIAPTQ